MFLFFVSRCKCKATGPGGKKMYLDPFAKPYRCREVERTYMDSHGHGTRQFCPSAVAAAKDRAYLKVIASFFLD